MKGVFAQNMGFTLMELIGVMAIVSIMAAVIAPGVFKVIDANIGDAENKNIKALAGALEDSITETKRIPHQNTTEWITATAAYVDLPTSEIEFNARNFRRRIYIDPQFFTTSNTTFTGYTQTSGLAQAPVSPRIMLVSDLTRNAPNPPTSNAAFSTIWDQTSGASVVEGPKVKIQRLNLAPLFHRVVLVNSNTQQPAYSIEAGSASPVPPAVGAVDGNITRYLLENSNLKLYADPYPSGALLTLAILNNDHSYRYETGGSVWAWVRQ